MISIGEMAEFERQIWAAAFASEQAHSPRTSPRKAASFADYCVEQYRQLNEEKQKAKETYDPGPCGCDERHMCLWHKFPEFRRY